MQGIPFKYKKCKGDEKGYPYSIGFPPHMCKPLIYYDKMCPPTYIRLVSERLNLDHIIYTEATEKPVGVEEIQVLASSGLFDKILVYGNSSFFIRHPKGSVPESEEISYLDNIWINMNDFCFQNVLNVKT